MIATISILVNVPAYARAVPDIMYDECVES